MLPALPLDVLELVFTYDIDGSSASTAHWLYCPGSSAFDLPTLHTVWVDVVFAAINDLPPVMASAAAIRTCRLERVGPGGITDEHDVGANAGVLGGCQALNVAIPIHWYAVASGRRGVAVTRLPGFPDSGTDDHVHLTPSYRALVSLQATLFMQDVQAITSPAGGNCSLVTLHRRTKAGPLPHSELSLINGAAAAWTVGTLRRRLQGVRR